MVTCLLQPPKRHASNGCNLLDCEDLNSEVPGHQSQAVLLVGDLPDGKSLATPCIPGHCTLCSLHTTAEDANLGGSMMLTSILTGSWLPLPACMLETAPLCTRLVSAAS